MGMVKVWVDAGFVTEIATVETGASAKETRKVYGMAFFDALGNTVIVSMAVFAGVWVGAMMTGIGIGNC
jgi:hypothetical protein